MPRAVKALRPARRAKRAVDESLQDLYARPGFLLRRGHQIAVAIFVQECAAIGLTPPQHGVLVVVGNAPGLDQAALARALGFDRATVGALVSALEARGMLQREDSATDARRKRLALTAAGRAMLAKAQDAVRRTSERLLSPLAPREREVFVRLLARLTDTLNAASRTPVESPGEN
jgi:DNA-binding MarR family transcriptional regulator